MRLEAIRRATIVLVTATIAASCLPARAEILPTVSIYTDKDAYQYGNTIEVSLSARNDGEGISVSVYVGLILPDGSLYTAHSGGWSDQVGPWMDEVYLRQWFWTIPTPFFGFDVPCLDPPIYEPGESLFAAALAHVGTLDFIGELAIGPFSLLADLRSDYYVDGELGDDCADGSEEAPWQTISHAVASVYALEITPVTVHIAPGTYSASTNGEAFPLNMKSWVSLSGQGAKSTILDAEEAVYQVICCQTVPGLVIEGLFIAGGKADGADWDGCGGGILCVNSSPTIQDCTISRNAGRFGGGIACYHDSSPLIQNNTVTGNSSEVFGGGLLCFYGSAIILNNTISDNWAEDRGGGMHFNDSSSYVSGNIITGNLAKNDGGGVLCRDGSLLVSDNEFTNNSCGGDGGGIYCSYSSSLIWGNVLASNTCGGDGGGILCRRGLPTLESSTITGNSANNGGGIHCIESSPTISTCTIQGNNAQHWGGGVSCYDNSSPTIHGNTITENAAAGDGLWDGFGGGICCAEYSSPSISNNIVSENTASADGGGIYCISRSSPAISSCTICSNTAVLNGGGILSYYDSWPTIVDCIVWGHGDDLCNCSGAYCCIQDGDAGEGNIHDAPVFVSTPFGRYYLAPESPCVDAGSRSSDEAGLSDRTTQADGTPDTGTVDMGFHHPMP